MPRTGSAGVPRQPGGDKMIGRPLKFGNQSRPNSLGGNQTALRGPTCIKAPCPTGFGSRQTGNGVNPRPFNVGNLPKPNSLGNRRETSNGGSMRPFNVANLPKANSLGSSRLGGSGGTPHTFSLANLPKANSLGNTHGANTGGNAHALNLANLPKANTLGGAQKGGNFHALKKSEGAVVGAAEKVGADQKQTKDDKTKLKNDAKNVATDKATEAKADAAFIAADSAQIQAQNKLNADKKNNAPPAIIAADAAKLKAAQAKTVTADIAFGGAVNKLAQDKKAEAADKKNVAADAKNLQQDKKTLGDKEKIAQQGAQIGKLETALKSANGANDQSSDNGQGSNNQSSDNGQASSGDNANNSTSDSGSSSGTVSTRSVDNTVVNNNRTIAAVGTSVGPGTALAARAAPVLPAPVAVAQTPAVADPTQDAAIGQTFVLVGFQKDVSDDDVAAFLKAYDASIVEGPNNDGLYKVQITSGVPSDQMQQVLDSMKSQTNIVLSAVAN